MATGTSETAAMAARTSSASTLRRINVGCGGAPTIGWTNYDNSFSVWLASHGVLSALALRSPFLVARQRKYLAFARSNDIRWADVTRRIPERDGSVDVVYSSHMFEHLDGPRRMRFLREVRRVLRPGGILRLAVPDIDYYVRQYLQDRDADLFVGGLRLTRKAPKNFVEKLQNVVVGDRRHRWMYDGPSLVRLLLRAGFADARVVETGTTTIPDPGNLNLAERAPESVFVEAVNP